MNDYPDFIIFCGIRAISSLLGLICWVWAGWWWSYPRPPPSLSLAGGGGKQTQQPTNKKDAFAYHTHVESGAAGAGGGIVLQEQHPPLRISVSLGILGTQLLVVSSCTSRHAWLQWHEQPSVAIFTGLLWILLAWLLYILVSDSSTLQQQQQKQPQRRVMFGMERRIVGISSFGSSTTAAAVQSIPQHIELSPKTNKDNNNTNDGGAGSQVTREEMAFIGLVMGFLVEGILGTNLKSPLVIIWAIIGSLAMGIGLGVLALAQPPHQFQQQPMSNTDLQLAQVHSYTTLILDDKTHLFWTGPLLMSGLFLFWWGYNSTYSIIPTIVWFLPIYTTPRLYMSCLGSILTFVMIWMILGTSYHPQQPQQQHLPLSSNKNNQLPTKHQHKLYSSDGDNSSGSQSNMGNDDDDDIFSVAGPAFTCCGYSFGHVLHSQAMCIVTGVIWGTAALSPYYLMDNYWPVLLLLTFLALGLSSASAIYRYRLAQTTIMSATVLLGWLRVLLFLSLLVVVQLLFIGLKPFLLGLMGWICLVCGWNLFWYQELARSYLSSTPKVSQKRSSPWMEVPPGTSHGALLVPLGLWLLGWAVSIPHA